MIKMYYLFSKLNIFAPTDDIMYPPCGMFTRDHIIILTISILLIILGLYLSRKVNEHQILIITRIIAITVTILELIKIGYNFYYGYTWLDAWLPLSFCSLFIYTTYMAGFGKGFIKRLGESYIACACLVCGTFFLICPTTSLMSHPVYHFLSLYSMFFHSLMVYLAILYLTKGYVEYNHRQFLTYVLCCVFFGSIAIILNTKKGCNMMFLREPYRIPLDFVVKIYNSSQVIYTLVILLAYIAASCIPFLIRQIKKKVQEKKKTEERIRG